MRSIPAGLVALVAVCASAETLPNEKALRELAKDHSCTLVVDETSKTVTVHSTRDGRASIANCQVPVGEFVDEHLLVLVQDPDHAWARCPTILEGVDGPPNGLHILEPLSAEKYIGAPTLEYFTEWRWGDPAEGVRGPEGVKASEPGIVRDVGGAGEMYYCHEGRWLFFAYH